MASLNIPNAFTNNTVADATKVTENFDSIETHVNINLVNIDGSVKAGTDAIANGAITTDKLASVVQQSFAPVGSIISYVGATAPTGWLICDGTTFNAATYPALNTLLGGNTLPNLQLRIPMGAGSGVAAKTAGGDRKIGTTHLPAHSHGAGTLGADGNGAHSHSFTTDGAGGHAHYGYGRQGATASHGHDGSDKFAMAPTNRTATDYAQVTSGQLDHQHNGSTSGVGNHGHSISGSTANTGNATDYFQPYYAVNYIIKAA